jgi:predicted dehydrogenase
MADANRRDFLKSSALAAGAVAFTAPAFAQSQGSPNGQFRVALLGLGGRMASHVASLLSIAGDNVEIVAICDCDQRKLDNVGKLYGGALKDKKLAVYTDMRKMFDDKSIDGIVDCLGDRWHSLAAIWACQAGKDVYVEKPGTHNLFEGRQMIAAARKYNRMLQHGTQNRSSPHIREGVQKLKDGIVGQIYTARGIDYKITRPMGKITPSECPAGLDWDKWLGPKAMRPYSEFWLRNRHSCGLDLSSAGFANQAVHELDVIRMGLGLDRHPVHVSAIGRKFLHKDDDSTAPTHYTATFQFDKPDTYVTYEYRSWYTNGEAGFRDQYPFVQRDYPVGTIFLGTEGYLIFPDYVSYRTFFGIKAKPGPFVEGPSEGCGEMANEPHMRNWVAACRARDHKLLNCDIEEGHKSMTLCLLARTSYQVGRPIKFDPDTETVVGDAEANALLNQPEYRTPYVVPKEV